MSTTTQNLMTRKSRAAEKIEFWMGINRRATASVCDADAYQDVDERTNWADISIREIRKLRALIEQLDAEIAAAEQVVEIAAEEPVAEPVVADPVAPVAYDVRLPNPPMPRRRVARTTITRIAEPVPAPVVADPVDAPVSYDVRLPNPPMPRRRTAR
jgi:hypothetical protein